MSYNPYQGPQATGGADSYSAGGQQVSPGVIRELLGTKPWVRLVSVLMFIGAGFMLIAGLIGMVAGSSFGGGAGALVGVIYLVFAIIYIIPALKLWKYGNGINQVAMTQNTQALEAAISEQRQFWKFTGIMIIVSFVLAIVLAVVGGMAAGRAAQQGSEFQRQFQMEMEKSMREAQQQQ
jgi:hypothetical protein